MDKTVARCLSAGVCAGHQMLDKPGPLLAHTLVPVVHLTVSAVRGALSMTGLGSSLDFNFGFYTPYAVR